MSRDQASILGVFVAVLLLFLGVISAIFTSQQFYTLLKCIGAVLVFWIVLMSIGKIGWIIGGSVHDFFRAIKISKEEW